MSSKDLKPGIVVLGVPRTGTTLLRRILDAHPNICCSGETFLLRAAARFIQSDTVADGIDYGVLGGLSAAGFPREDVLGSLREFCVGFLEAAAARAGKPRWASKSAVDSFHVEAIDRIFGGHVRYVCIVRHGLDAVCSLGDLTEANRVFVSELHDYIVRYPAPLDAYAHAWSEVSERLLRLSRDRADEAILLRYEDLVAEPDRTLTDLFGFLEEDYGPELLADAFAEQRVSGLGDWKTYGKDAIDAESVGRYAELSDTEQSRLGAIVNPVLSELGYDPIPLIPDPDPDDAMRRHEMQMPFKAARARSESESDS